MQTLNESRNEASRAGMPSLYSGHSGDWLVAGSYGPEEFYNYAYAEATAAIIEKAAPGATRQEKFRTPGAPIVYVLVDPDNAEAIASAESIIADLGIVYYSDEYSLATSVAMSEYLVACNDRDRLETQRAIGIDLYAYGYSAQTGRQLDGQLAVHP